jgi:hypothetical protein
MVGVEVDTDVLLAPWAPTEALRRARQRPFAASWLHFLEQ